MTAVELDAFLRTELPQLFNYDDVTIEHADGRSCRVRQRFRESMLRPGGTISGPSIMGLADLALFVALLGAIGPVDQAVTSNLNITFLRRPQPAALLAECRLFRVGRRLASGDVALRSENSDAIVAHATATYAIPERE